MNEIGLNRTLVDMSNNYKIINSVILSNMLKNFQNNETYFKIISYYLLSNISNLELNDEFEKLTNNNLLKKGASPDDILELIRKIMKEMEVSEKKEYEIFREISKTMGDILELNELETKMFDFVYICGSTDIEEDSKFSLFSQLFRSKEKMIANIFDTTVIEAKKMMDGVLFKAPIFTENSTFYYLISGLSRLYSFPNLTIDKVSDVLFPNMISTTLSVSDYEHMSNKIEICENILKNSKNQKGMNIMFWGPPGTGKTELSFVLAEKLGYEIKVIGDVSESNMSENSRNNRLVSLKIATAIYKNKPNIMLLFDEMEDLMKFDMQAEFSKAYINRIMESTKVPIIWTANYISMLPQPVRRRMMYNINCDTPNATAREKIWEKYLKENKIKLSKNDIKLLSNDFEITPAIIRNISLVVGLSGDTSLDNIYEVAGSINKFVNYAKDVKKSPSDNYPYDVKCAKADVDLDALVDKLQTANKNFSICMYGIPGSGKTRYGTYLAEKLNMGVMIKKYSDLSSMWVGESEELIAAAFAEASADKKILIIDEGDSFLRDRKKSRNSWETTQVNEMLSQMENHDQPFILSTNLMEDIDEAALRRFTFKIKFDYLDTEQSKKLFKQYFGKNAPAEILRNEYLSPGDFANVKKQVDILNISDSATIYDMLKKETDLKSDSKKHKIGF